MKSYMVKRYSSIEAYVPGEQPRDLDYVKLNTNESPFPPSPKAAEILGGGEAENLKLYPDPEGKDLRDAIAKRFDVKRENVLLGNGSDEILAFAFFAFCAGEKCVFPDISYGFYKVFAELVGAEYKEIPLGSDFKINVADYENAGATVVIANPNAPTGLALTADEVERIVKTNPDNIVVIDEAYVDFGAESAVPLTKKYDNLVVVQTYSKSRSLAGARLGFAIASSGVIDDMNKIKYSLNPYNINRLTLKIGKASIEDEEYFLMTTSKIVENRIYTTEELRRRGFYVLDSKTNFVFARSAAVPGEKLYLELKRRGVLVRHFGADRIKDFVRITIGTREQTDVLLAKTDEILKEANNG